MQRYRVKLLSCALSVLMLLSMIVPHLAIAAQSFDETGSTLTKIHPRLHEAFEEQEEVRYLVVLNEQVNTNEVARQVEEKGYRQSLSKQDISKNKQKAVVSALMDSAEKTQKNIMEHLDLKKRKGEIHSFKSFYIVNALAVKGDLDSAEDIAARPEVKSVLLDEKQYVVPMEETNDQNETDSEVEWNVDRVGAPYLWEEGIDGEGTVVASLDSGVNWRHPAVKRQYRGYKSDDPDNPTHEFNWFDAVSGLGMPMDSDGHGTHTVGTMVGQEADGTNKIGVAPGAEWIATRAFYMGEGYDSYILAAAQWLLAPTDEEGVPHPEKAPDVINNSWGGNPINNDWFRPMVQAWRNAGIVPVFSVGNAGLFMGPDPGTASAPANYPESIAVGATDGNDQLAGFSLRGPSETGVMKPDLTAPGVSVRSSVPGETWDTYEYAVANGTSMAAPHVAATVALMKQVNNELTVDQIDSILKYTATAKTDDQYTNHPNNGFGYGLLDSKAAVDFVEQGFGTISGEVTGVGTDTEAPRFEHHPRRTVFIGEDEAFSIRAMDNISVNSVTLTIINEDQVEKTYTAERVKGDHLDGVYETIVPSADILGSSLQYVWKIEDYSGNIVSTDAHSVEIKEGISAGHIEDFENNPDGWYSFGIYDSWEWGVPEYGPDQATSGQKVMGTELRAKYQANADMTLVTPPILAEEGLQLRFKNWYSLGWFGDQGTIYASVDGENWDQIYQITRQNKEWHEVGLDLSDYAGQKVYIAFNLMSIDNQSQGWYIDDVQLVQNSPQEANNQYKSQQKAFSVSKAQNKTNQTTSHQMTSNELPLDATITVEETGWTTKANPQDGTFIIYHPPGEYTLKIEAYGYETTTEVVILPNNETVNSKINLNNQSKQTISGGVKDILGNQISNANVRLLEDDKVAPVYTDDQGDYQLHALTGEYTVVVSAEGYQTTEQTITVVEGEDQTLDVVLQPFYRNESTEIKYDNGSWSKNLVMGKKNNGFAVRMSLEEDQSSALLTGAKLQFWASHIPDPGGDDINISVYDATGEDGAPGHKIAGPIAAKAERDLYSWTEVDLSEHGITVTGDFYIVYTQADDYPHVPGFVADGDAKNATGRSWDYFGGQWFQANTRYGNYMIRAVVDYGKDVPDMSKPIISSPEPNTFTNESNITVEGTASPEVDLQLRNNGVEQARAVSDEDGTFSFSTSIEEGENALTVVSLYEGAPVNASEVTTIIKDTTLPALNIESPVDGQITNKESVIVSGTVGDDHLEVLKVNGEQTVIENNQFEKRVLLDEGENVVHVMAQDKAGNMTEETITVHAQFGDPLIEHIEPSDDQYVLPGDEVLISFTSSTTGGIAKYSIKFPELNQAQAESDANMNEVEPGVYTGSWTVPKGINLEGAIIEVQLTDQAGNTTVTEAPGRLYIHSQQLERISGENRYETAIEISENGWKSTDTVILARGNDYADALSGVPLAYQYDAPILLTSSAQLNPRVLDEITRLNAQHIIILGGTQAVSEDIEQTLEDEGLTVDRLSGQSRYETASAIAEHIAPNGVEKAVVVNGMNFPDALSVASYAAQDQMPILLTRTDTLPEATTSIISSLGIEETIIVGGTVAVSNEVAEVLPHAQRIEGHNRYATNIALANHFEVSNPHMYIATGRDYADALSGAVLAAKEDSAILLTGSNVPDELSAYLVEQDVHRVSVLGGKVAVSDNVANEILALIK
ncbi:cell wall-binding repeat-containing protein [Lentibacillus saliphilus]|uniref:cell wall-binding repeat-containing protein n=1 Tax=Lentibacillus saliphilus TaxID=2737028 RepID=UPI001FE8C591|nr:cell wall-binding repeat-containing protein [Lentibacillus saliphilus]